MPNLAVKVIDRLFVVVYGATDPTDQEWQGYLRQVELHGVDRTMQLVCTDGGEPTTSQRRALVHVMGTRQVPVAVLSGSVRVRGTVTALSWFNPKIRAFAPTGLLEALAYLEVPVSRGELIAREIIRLRGTLDREDGGAVRAARGGR